MLNTDAEIVTFYVLEDRQGHRITREAPLSANNSRCSFCGGGFVQLAAVTRLPGEAEIHHRIRAMSLREKRSTAKA